MGIRLPDVTDENFGTLVRRAYAAGLDRTKWSDFLAELSDLLGHSWIALHAHDISRNANIGFLTHNYSPAHHASYLQHFGSQNPWNPQVARVAVGRVVHSRALLAPEALKRTEFYNDWIRPQEDIGTGAGVTLYRDRDRFLRLSCNIRFRDMEAMEQRLLLLLEAIGPHVRASFELSRRLAGARIGRHYQEALQRLSEAVLLIDHAGRVCLTNAAAERLLSAGSELFLSGDHRLGFADGAAQHTFEAALASIVHGPVKPSGPTVLRAAASGLEAELFPFVPDEAPVRPPLLLLLDDLPAAILMFRQPAAAGALATAARRYGWSPTEAALCRHLLEGGSVRSFSEQRGVSLHTARNQMRSVLEKAGVQRQSALIALVAGLERPH